MFNIEFPAFNKFNFWQIYKSVIGDDTRLYDLQLKKESKQLHLKSDGNYFLRLA